MHIITMAVAMIAPPMATQARPSEPSVEAMELARELDLRTPVILRGMIADAGAIEAELLSVHYAPLGPPCERSLPACRDAAKAVAMEVAPKKLAHLQEVSARYFARIFDAKMSKVAIKEALPLARTPMGKSLAQAMRIANGFEEPEAGMHFLRIAYEEVRYGGPKPIEIFYERTKNLPRARPRVAPIAPPPPPAPPPRNP